MAKLFNLEPITAPKPVPRDVPEDAWLPPSPSDSPELGKLADIIKTLFPVTRMSRDPEDRRGVTNCVCYTKYAVGSYLMASNSHCLIAVKLTEAQAAVIDGPGGPAVVASVTGLHWGRGKAISGREAYLWGSKTWDTDAGVMPGNPEPVPYWPRLIPTTYITPEGGAVPFNASLVAQVDRAVNSLLKLEGKPELDAGLSPLLVGDTKNNTTARVWASGNLLAMVMPLLRRGAEARVAGAVKDFMAPFGKV